MKDCHGQVRTGFGGLVGLDNAAVIQTAALAGALNTAIERGWLAAMLPCIEAGMFAKADYLRETRRGTDA